MNRINWLLDPAHSEIGFKVRHMMITNVKGNFEKFDIKVESDNEQFDNLKVELSVETASVNTWNEGRNAHLRSADFFDSDNFPIMKFKSSRFLKSGDDRFTLEGELTIKDKTNPVKMDVEFGGILKDPWGNTKAGFTIMGKINRKDWGLVWNTALETGGMLVGEEVNIICELELTKPN